MGCAAGALVDSCFDPGHAKPPEVESGKGVGRTRRGLQKKKKKKKKNAGCTRKEPTCRIKGKVGERKRA